MSGESQFSNLGQSAEIDIIQWMQGDGQQGDDYMDGDNNQNYNFDDNDDNMMAIEDTSPLEGAEDMTGSFSSAASTPGGDAMSHFLKPEFGGVSGPFNANAPFGNAPSFGSFGALNSSGFSQSSGFTGMSMLNQPDSDLQQTLEQIQYYSPSVTSPVIGQVQAFIENQFQTQEKIRAIQRELVINPKSLLAQAESGNSSMLSTLQLLLQQQQQLKDEINKAILALSEARLTHLLDPRELHLCIVLTEDLAVQTMQLSLFQHELQALATSIQRAASGGGQAPSGPATQLASLVIHHSSFPNIWIKKNQLSEPESIQVRVLTAAAVQLVDATPVKAVLNCHNQYNAKTKKPKPMLDTDTAIIDQYQHTAKFQFTFLAGTRKDIAQVRFGMQARVRLPGGQVDTIDLYSPDSKPFLIITNESQFGESLGILLMKDMFHYSWGKTVPQIPWSLFANVIQYHFIKATRQDIQAPKRPLSRQDINYIHTHFFAGKQVVDQKSFEHFWDWFGKVLQKVRYQRHWTTMWIFGLLYGFIHRDSVLSTVLPRAPGTCLLRFSESNAGSIAIGYKVIDDGGKVVKNYLVKPDDVNPTRSLPDFIGSRPEFQYMLQFTGEYDGTTGVPKFVPVHKSVAFAKMYSPKKDTSDAKTGAYDDL